MDDGTRDPRVDAYIDSLPAWQAVFVYDPIAPDPTGLVNQGQANRTARAIQVREGDVVDEDALVELFRAVIRNNRAGGWRRVQEQA